MGKHTRQPPQALKQLKPVDYIKQPDVITGVADITRPRDIYSFLSLGYINADPTPNQTHFQKQNATTGVFDYNYNNPLHVSTGNLPSSSYPEWEENNPSSYILFDTLNTHSKLPAIQTNNTSEGNEDGVESEINENEQVEIGDTPRKSLINEDDHKINITQTYIFAPPDRLPETFKYNKNLILPKIKPKKTSTGDQETNPTTKQVQINPVPTEISPRATEMNANNYIFGARPECLFINNRLGDRNPLLRSNKESPSLSVPKASPGLPDLKDFDEYPDVYWKLRDGTITNPDDLEADMIDRDLYRLRQISALKLNSIEKTFQVSQDPFRRWRWKAGEPVFSPRQQQRPLNRSFREKKLKDIPIYPQALSKPKLKVNVSPIKPVALHTNDYNEYNTKVMDDPRVNDNNDYHVSKVDTPFADNLNLPPLDTPRDSLGGNTPREVVAASLESFRRKDEELAEGDQFGKIPIQKMHQLRLKQHKQSIKTSLVKVDMGSLETYKKEHRNSSMKPICKNNSKGVGHSHKLESFRENYVNNEEPKDTKLNTDRSEKGENVNGGAALIVTTNEENNDDLNNNTNTNNEDINPNAKKVPVPVSTLVLQPDLSRLSLCPPGDIINNWDAETGTLNSAAAMMNRPGLTSPVVSDSSGISKEKRKNSNITPVKPVKLEVFSERVPGGDCVISIPTGRVSYSRNMPTYKLDLVNYPPSNPRQSCHSAGISDGRHTQYTTTNTNALTPRSRLQEVRSSHTARGANGDQSDKNIPPQSRDTNISIRFGQQGQVIVSSSREGRRSR